jgi:hypothetical protein
LIEERSRELLEGLRKRGFKTTLGEDDSGFLLMAWNKGGGYYLGWSIYIIDWSESALTGMHALDVGASQMIIDGEIKLKSDGPIKKFTPTGLLFEDGSTLDADVVLFATGYAFPIG